MPAGAHNYRLGSLYAISTALLLSVQEPLSFLAAKRLDADSFVLITQVSLLVSIPLLLISAKSRSDFVAILRNPAMYGKLAVIFALGMTGLLLYKRGLSGAHPVIVAAIFNLSPFWAALVARVVSRVPVPVQPAVFFGCLASAFLGAMAVAWSQLGGGDGDLTKSFFEGSWVFAIPIPILSALNGTLIGKWFSRYDESAAIGVNFLAPAVVLIPTVAFAVAEKGDLGAVQIPAILLMMLGTIVAASIGRVLYQVALTATNNDNGFVTMFFLLVPALTGLVSLPLSYAIPELDFRVNALFFVGLGLIAAALAAFSWMSWRRERAGASVKLHV
jgi:drug/metabolite transporter (DMT)-like permease